MLFIVDNVRLLTHPLYVRCTQCLTAIALNELYAAPGAFLSASLLEALLLNELPKNSLVPASA
jgi:hypothetical protein